MVSADHLVIERIKVDTQPMLTAEEISARDDAVADLHTLLQGAASDPVLVETLKVELAVLVGRLPHDLDTQDLAAVRCVKEGNIGELIESVAPAMLDRVSGDR